MNSENFQVTLANKVIEMSARYPDYKILTFEYGDYPEEVLTYRDIVANGGKLARHLKEQGIGSGDKCAVMMCNTPEFVYAFFAASATGSLIVPIDPRTKGDKLAYLINNSDSKGIIISSDLLPVIQEVMPRLKGCQVLGVVYKDIFGVETDNNYPNLNVILAGAEVDKAEADRSDFDRSAVDLSQVLKANPATPLEIIYTSGTTGNPKGVMFIEERLATYALFGQTVWQYKAADILYTGLSLTHGNAQAVTLFPALFLRIPAVISHKFTKSRIWDICRKYGCTTFSLLGGMLMGIYSEPVKANDADNPVRLVISAGTTPTIWREFETRFGVQIHEWYAASEGGFAHNPPGQGPVGSFGKPLPGVMEMKVVREDDTECAPFEKGELICWLLKGPTVVEYYGNKQASEDKTRGGWLRMGDICHYDAEGWFYFDFRVGGGIRRHGEFIQPEYVEKVIAGHPEVSDVCVYGIPAATGSPGESDIIAAVVPFPGKALNIQSLIKTCREGLERNAVPAYLQVVQAIPKTASEKNLVRLLQEEFSPKAANVHELNN